MNATTDQWPLDASFFLFSAPNFGVFMSGYYGFTFDGFVTCYVMALPFWQNSLIADFTSTALVFGLYLLAIRAVPSARVAD